MTRVFFVTLTLFFTRFNSVSGVCDNCLIGDLHCDQITGNCWYGCRPGWTGNRCTEHCKIKKCAECFMLPNSTEMCDRCENGYYGDKCENQCSQHCIIQRCNSGGDCIFGCTSYWTGPKCNQIICNFDHCEQCEISAIYHQPICARCVQGMFFSYEHYNCVNCGIIGFTCN